MFGLDADRRPLARAADVQPYLLALESLLERFGGGRAAPARADTLADLIGERLSDIAGRLQRHASRTGSEASRLGGRLAESGRDTATLFSKEVGANPMVAVGAALAIGAIVGIALARRPRRQVRTPVRTTRKGSRQ